jgi:hypothetical protein
MQLFAEDIAMEVVKTLLSSDQRELIDKSAEMGISTAKGMARCSFEIAEAFLEEYNERYSE